MNASRAPGADGAGDPPRILVVEDEVIIRDLIASVLREMGAIVAEAASVEEAWGYLAAGFPVDLVFTDNRTPGSMTGLDLAKRIKAEHPKVEVVLVSGDWHSLEWTEPVLAKPYPLDQTAAELARRALLARRKE